MENLGLLEKNIQSVPDFLHERSSLLFETDFDLIFGFGKFVGFHTFGSRFVDKSSVSTK